MSKLIESITIHRNSNAGSISAVTWINSIHNIQYIYMHLYMFIRGVWDFLEREWERAGPKREGERERERDLWFFRGYREGGGGGRIG